MQNTWLQGLVDVIDLDSIPKSEQKLLREFLSQFTNDFIPTKKDTTQVKAAKVEYIKKNLPKLNSIMK